MPTDKQREASRRNGAKSRGPKTEEGKAASRFNAVRHGLASSIVVLPHESYDDFRNMFEDYVARYQPVDVPELCCIEEIVVGQWLMRRALAAERFACVEDTQQQRATTNERWHAPVPEHIYYLMGAAESMTNGRARALHRYVARCQRSYRLAMRTLNELQAGRPPHLRGGASTPPQAQMENLQNEPAEALTPAESTPAAAATAAEPGNTTHPARPALRKFTLDDIVYRLRPIATPEINAPQPENAPKPAPQVLRMCA
jgi:hypothetical protein